jgi:hypothetical protein
MYKKRYFLVLVVLTLFLSAFSQVVIHDFESTADLNNDNTGATFELSGRYVYNGNFSTIVVPSGSSNETKLAFELSGETLKKWLGNDTLRLALYINPISSVKPNTFFLGMAEVTQDWEWVDGIFSETEVKDGWNLIEYRLSEKMQDLLPDNKYMLYFSFFYSEGSAKLPLKDPLYVDNLVALNSQEPQTERVYIWNMDTIEEINTFGNDNTGTVFELAQDRAAEGLYSMKVIPNGEAIETKIAIELSGEKIISWSGSNKVTINIYIPKENEIKPEMYFLGMASLIPDWLWVGGVFSQTPMRVGWNKIEFEIAGDMSKVKDTNQYMVYLAFAGYNQNKEKVPLTEPFYIDGIFVEKLPKSLPTVDEMLSAAPSNVKEEVEKLLELDDESLLDEIQKRTFMYLWKEVNPENGLVKDRSTEDSPSSIAAVGMALSAIPIGIERGWITYDQGYERALTTLKTFVEGKVEGLNGFFYHFVNMNTGKREWQCELSSIDTALLVAGALTAGSYFEDTEVDELANKLYENVNWQWMLAGGDTLSMGWKPEGGFLGANWDSFNEGLLAYVLAIGSPTYPIPAESWDKIYRPVKNDTYIYLPQETLFVYQYPNIWIDFRDKEDKYANYFNNTTAATRYNWLYAVQNRFKYETYDMDIWGLSASDGPTGYRAYGAVDGNNDGTVAPYASISSIPFTPDISMNAIRGMLSKYGPLVWGEYGFYSAFNVDELWFSDQYIGIDQGDIILMIENYRTGFIWELFMKNENIQKALDEIGFIEKVSDYAVTPWYVEEYNRSLTTSSEKLAYATRVSSYINIDGDLEEWKNVPKTEVTEDMNVPSGGIIPVDKRSQVLHSYFQVTWDDQNLYLAADVYDEVVVSNIAPDDIGNYYRTDSIEFYINPAVAGSDVGIFKLAILPFDTEGNVQAVRHEDAKPGPISKTAPKVEVASKRTDYGYAVEVKIPFEYLGITNPQPGLRLGFSHTVHNSNRANAAIGEYVRENIISWNPVPAVWGIPQKWGAVELK